MEKPKFPDIEKYEEGKVGQNLRKKNKVYCKDCKYYQRNFVGFYCYHITPEQCHAPQNEEKYDTHSEIIISLKGQPYVLNKDNNCRYYRRKWYKFWIKQENGYEIKEGIIKKGGINHRPTTPRPEPPKGQGE